MIITLSLSPSLDKTYVVDGLEPDRVNYASKNVVLPGSKGINVSRMLTSLNVPNIAIGFCGGVLGGYFKTLLEMENVNYDFVETDADIRFNVKIADIKTGAFTDLNEYSAPVTTAETESLFNLYRKKLDEAEYVVIAGAARTGMAKDVYNEFIRIASSKGKKVLFDCSGEALRYALYEKPYLICPNDFELSEYAGRNLETDGDIIEVLSDIHEKGVTYAIATMGEKGAIMVCDSGTFKMTPPPVKSVNTTGAGDSFLAGIIYGLKNNSDCYKMLKLAGSIAAVKVTKEDTAMPGLIEAFGMLDLVSVEKL